MLRRFGFASWLRDYQDMPDETTAELEVVLVSRQTQLDQLVDELKQAELIAFDTETTSLEPLDAELVGFCLCDDAESGVLRSAGPCRSGHRIYPRPGIGCAGADSG